MKDEIIIIGTSGHAKVIHDIVIKEGRYKPVAFFSSNETLKDYLGLPHFHQNELKNHSYEKGIIGVGDNATREFLVGFIKSAKPQFKFINAIHPSAQIGTAVQFGEGVTVMAGVVINSATHIGNHVILNSSCSYDHDGVIEDYASIAPGCIIGGNVKVGRGSAVSLGAKIIHGINVGSNSVIGAGAIVLKDVPGNVVAYGSPCEIVRSRKSGDKYL